MHFLRHQDLSAISRACRARRYNDRPAKEISGFGIAIVTSSALSAIPPEHSGMAASATNTSRELGAVVGVTALGSVVNGQLTNNLVRQLAAIGIPAP